MTFSVKIRVMEPQDIDLVLEGLTGYDVYNPRTDVERCWTENLTGQRTTFLALDQDDFAGWAHLVYSSDYSFFKENNIPESQNLDVVPPLRRRGVGSQLLHRIEQFAFRRYDVIGIGFGLYADYGMV